MIGERTKRAIDRLPFPLAVTAGAVLIVATAAWLLFVGVRRIDVPSAGDATPTPRSGSGSTQLAATAPAKAPVVIPEAALRANFAPELFPKPVTAAAATAESPKRQLTLQLLAIIGEGEKRRVFVRDPAADLYYDLGIGEPASPGVVLSEIGATTAVFVVAGAEPSSSPRPSDRVTLELPK